MLTERLELRTDLGFPNKWMQDRNRKRKGNRQIDFTLPLPSNGYSISTIRAALNKVAQLVSSCSRLNHSGVFELFYFARAETPFA